MMNVHNIEFKNGDSLRPITYVQETVLHDGDIINAKFDMPLYSGEKKILVKEFSSASSCSRCPFYVNEIVDSGGNIRTCAAIRQTRVGRRHICLEGTRAYSQQFEFEDMDEILEEL